jgi:hypothetical protein
VAYHYQHLAQHLQESHVSLHLVAQGVNLVRLHDLKIGFRCISGFCFFGFIPIAFEIIKSISLSCYCGGNGGGVHHSKTFPTVAVITLTVSIAS